MVKAGDALVTVHGDADPDRVSREIERGFDEGAELAEADLKQTGREIGDTISKSAGKEIERQGPELAKSIEKGIGRRKIKVKTTIEPEVDHNVGERIVSSVVGDVERAFSRAGGGGGPGGPFGKIGQAFADAIGAGFNISGRSPLIAFLVPAIGAIIALVLAAIQAANALLAVLATIPTLIGGIAVQVGVLVLAFHGMGEAIQGAFAAKNAKELNEAIKNLTPSARQFVKELLPLRDLFNTLVKLTQESFFKGLGSIIPQLQKALGPGLVSGFSALADAMGRLFRSLALFFSAPEFVNFVNKLFPATIQFLKVFGPSLVELLRGLTIFGTAIMPFLNLLGQKFSDSLFELGAFLVKTAKDPNFKRWLDDMSVTLDELGKFFKAVIGFVFVLGAQLDAAGGTELIRRLTEDLEAFTAFLASPTGEKALEGLVNTVMILTEAFLGILAIILIVFAAIQSFAEWLKGTGGPAIIEFFVALGLGLDWVAAQILAWFTKIGTIITDAFEKIKKFFTGLMLSAQQSLNNVITTINSLPGKIQAAVANFVNALYTPGRNLIQGFINGMLSMANPLVNAAKALINRVVDFFPGSPAVEGPLSGKGYSLYRGQRMVQDFAEGIRMEIPDIRAASNEATSNIVFGRDAIRVTFEGALPTEEQAQQTGAAVGAGINGQLAARNTRLAVRTL